MSLLAVKDLEVTFGAVHAVRGVSLTLEPGSSTAIVGSNGAGKSSTLFAIARALDRSAKCGGEIALAPGNNVAMVPEREKVFTLLTVDENLIAADRSRGRGRVRIDDIYGWFPRLAERRTSLAGNLSGGEQQMLAIGMSLAGNPSLLLFDEPTLGLAVPIIERTCDTLMQLRRELSLTLLCTEAEPQWVDRLADRVLVMARGKFLETIDGNIDSQKERIRSLSLGLEESNS